MIAALIEQLNVAAARSMRDPRMRIDPGLISQLAVMGPDAVAPLLAELEKGRDSHYYAFKVFAEMDVGAVPLLIETYRNGHVETTKRALEAVLINCGQESQPLFISLTKDADPKIRRVGISAIFSTMSRGIAADDPLNEVIVAALEDSNGEVRAMVPALMYRAYAGQSDLAAKLIELRLSHADEMVRYGAVTYLSSLARDRRAGEQAIKPIIAAIADAVANDSSQKVRAAAAHGIGELGEKGSDAWPALLAAAQKYGADHSIEEALQRTGLAAGIALREAGIEDEEMITLISQLAGSGQMASTAKAKLIRMGPGNLELLMTATRLDVKNRYWSSIARVGGGWGPGVLPALDAYVADESDVVRRTVAMDCGEMQVGEVPAPLVVLLKDDDMLVRTYALDALVALSERPSKKLKQAVVPLLFEGLAGEPIHYTYWPKAMSALAKIGPEHPAVVDGLIGIMKQSPDESYRAHAARDLADLARRLREDHADVERIVSALVSVVQEETSRDVRRRTIWSIGNVGARATAALPALRKAEDDPYADIAEAAREAIGKINEASRQ